MNKRNDDPVSFVVVSHNKRQITVGDEMTQDL